MKCSKLTAVGPTSNPFATRYVRAGAIPFRFPPNQSADTLQRRLVASNWHGQIVGPHGSGKTTLLRTLDPYWSVWGRLAVTIILRDRQRQFPAQAAPHPWIATTQLIVDGYEQLTWASRLWLMWQCRRAGCGLLVTTHRDQRLPTIMRTSPTTKLACELVLELTGERRRMSEAVVVNAFEQQKGNLRETFLQLYDQW